MNYADLKPEDTLTPRQFEAVKLLVRGMRHAEIARTMEISEDTVKTHLKFAGIKAGTETPAALAVWYVRRYPDEKAEHAGFLRVLEVHAMYLAQTRRLQQARRALRLGK